MRKNHSVFVMLFFASTTMAIAQNCNQGERLAQKTWEKWGPWQPSIDLTGMQNGINKVKNAWNWIAQNGGATIGPRFLEINGVVEDGSIAGQTKRTFVTHPSAEDDLVLTINKYDGKAETGVVVCSMGYDGVLHNLLTYTFPNGNQTQTKSFRIKGDGSLSIRGQVIIVAMRNKSVGNKFKYRIKIQPMSSSQGRNILGVN